MELRGNPQSRGFRRCLLWLLAILIIAPFVVPGLNCRFADINIKTGQMREYRRIWYITVSTTYEDTLFSNALGGEAVDVARVNPWQRIYSQDLSIIDVHRGLRSFSESTFLVNKAWRKWNCTPEEKRETARNVLELWQRKGFHSGARDFLIDIEKNGPANRKPDGQSDSPTSTTTLQKGGAD